MHAVQCIHRNHSSHSPPSTLPLQLPLLRCPLPVSTGLYGSDLQDAGFVDMVLEGVADLRAALKVAAARCRLLLLAEWR